MLTRASSHLPGYFLKPAQRGFSAQVSIRDRFQEAWLAQQAAAPKKTAAQVNYKADYMRNKKGYVHPYHTSKHPLIFSSPLNFWNTLSQAAGPEQVSPHYESLSRSRRGLIFLFAYIGTITTVAQLGGWDHNEWIRGLVFHHEFLLAFYVGYAEIRHFTWLPGPKFSVFYDVFSKYEFKQLMAQWNDTMEEQ